MIEVQQEAGERADGPTLTSLFEAWQLSKHLDPDALMRQVVPKIAQAFRADRVSLMLLDEEAQELTVRAAVGLAQVTIGAHVGVGRPIAGWVALKGRPLLLPNGSETPVPVQRAMKRPEIRSALSVPLRSDGRVIGVLNLARLNGHPFTPQDLRFTSMLGDRIGPCVETARLYGDLEEQQALSAAILEELPTGLLVVDQALRVVSANRSFLLLTRREASQTIGHKLGSVLPGARQGHLEGHVREALRQNRQVDVEKLIVRTPGLPARVYACRLHPLETRRGMERVTVVLEDITERERLEEERERAQRHLATVLAGPIGSATPASLELLASAIAHELRNPLANALACAQVLIEGPVRERDRADGLLRIHASIQRAVEVVESLLRIATSSGQWAERVNVNDLLAETHVLVDDHLTSQKVRLTMDLAPELPPVQAKPVLLEQVFTNVVLNASAAMDGGGDLAVRTSVREGMVEIRFTDTGCGIPREHLARIFEPFFTTRAPGGTGLGLSISRTIVEQHKGTIEVQSEVGRGTTVIVGLPVAPVAASAA